MALTGAEWLGFLASKRLWIAVSDTARLAKLAAEREPSGGQTYAVLWIEFACRRGAMARQQKSRPKRTPSPGTMPDDLYDYLRPAVRRRGRPAKKDRSEWTVTDDWPEEVPITEAEVEVFEAWFGDLFDERFSTRH